MLAKLERNQGLQAPIPQSRRSSSSSCIRCNSCFSHLKKMIIKKLHNIMDYLKRVLTISIQTTGLITWAISIRNKQVSAQNSLAFLLWPLTFRSGKCAMNVGGSCCETHKPFLFCEMKEGTESLIAISTHIKSERATTILHNQRKTWEQRCSN